MIFFKNVFLFFILLCFSFTTNAEFVFSTGVTSITNGRVSPLLNTGLDTSSYAFTFSSVGVKNSYYYHSGYNVVWALQKDFTKSSFGGVRAGLGLGAHFAKRGLQDGTNALIEKSDYAIGPAMRVTWGFLPYCFMGLESIYGIRGANFIALSTQNIHSLFLGVRF